MPVSNANLQLRFDGPELREHEMDVILLGPALFAFGEMCQEANRIINGDSVKMKVKLSADVEANCVTIQLAIAQSSVWATAAAFLLNQDNLATAKDILAWIGVIEKPVGATMNLVRFLLWKKDKKKVTEVERRNDGNVINVTINGDGNTVVMPEQVYALARSAKVVESFKAVTSSVSEKNGIDEATFVHDKKEQLKVDKSLAKLLRGVHAQSDGSAPQPITAHIVIYAPIIDPSAKVWKFKLNKRVEKIDISETTIAADAIERGYFRVGDRYRVRLEVTERQTPRGNFKFDYKVKEVLDFKEGNPTFQQNLF